MATKKPTKKPTTTKRVNKPLKKTAHKVVTKKPVAKKMVNKKPITKRAIKPVTKKTTTRKPVSRKTTSQKTHKAKLNKQGLLFVGLGVITAIFLGVFILPNVLKSFTKDKPVLGYRVAIPSNATIPHASFKDKNFYACVIGNLNNFKINNKTNRTFSHKATDAELKELKVLNCSNHGDADIPLERRVKNSTGLEKISNLTHLNLNCNSLSSINLTNQTKLTELDLFFTGLSSINLNNQKNLTSLNLGYNSLSSINLTNQTKLTELYLNNNKLTSINLANQSKLIKLYLNNNKLTSINLTNLKKLGVTSTSVKGNTLSPQKVRMLTSNYTYSGGNINVNTTNRATILNNIFRFASDIDIRKYIVTASGSKVTSGDYKDGDKVVVEALGIKEERPIAVTSNPGKITSAQWVRGVFNRQAPAPLKFKSDMAQDWYNLVCYTTDDKKVLENIKIASTAKSDGYRYSDSTYSISNRKCYLSGVIRSNGKNVWGASTLIK